MLARTRFDNVTTRAIPKLFANSRKIDGSRFWKTYRQASSVGGFGMNVSSTASGCVLNDVISDQANGMNIRTAYVIITAYAARRRQWARRSPTRGAVSTSASRARGRTATSPVRAGPAVASAARAVVG